MRGRASLVALAALAALVTAACHEPVQVRPAEAIAAVEPAVVDFGEVPVGEWRELETRVKNVGVVSFRVLEALALDGNPSFAVVALDGQDRLMPGEERAVQVRFHPLREGEHRERVSVETDAEDHPSRPVSLQGTGTPARVTVEPAVLDFEMLEVDSDRWLEVTVHNPTDLPLTVDVAGEGADQFESGALTIPPSGSFPLAARFFPRQVGRLGARLELRPCPDCTPATGGLRGTSVSSALAFDPAPIPFEDIPVHETTRSRVRVQNVTWRPVQVVRAVTSDRAFTVLTGLAGLQLPPGQSTELELQFAARASGPSVGALEVGYVSDRGRTARVYLDARAGRPSLALAPAALDFGELPVGAKAERVIRLSNAGVRGNLLLRGMGGRGPGVGHFDVSEPFRGRQRYPYSGGAWPAYAVADLPIAPGEDSVDVKVYFEPLTPGEHRAEVLVRTDDLFSPERAVVVTGRARPSGTCTLRLSPHPLLDFGVVQTGRGAVQGFRFENVGAQECAVKDIHLSRDAGGAFFMPGGPLTGGVVLPGSAFSAQIAFRPARDGVHEGELSITVNDPAAPVAMLRLLGNGFSRTCLAAAPPFLDFGPVRLDCSPPPRRGYLVNQCATPVTVARSWIGPGTSEQFSVRGGPAFPLTLGRGEGFEVEVAYSRTILGQHFSPLFFQVEGEPGPYLLPLLAETNHEGVQIDRFIQGTDRQLDLLLVVSNTTTMPAYQDRLKAAIPGFIARARDRGVDVNVGVTTTGLFPRSPLCPGGAQGGEAGRLFPVDGSRPRVMSSTSGAAVATVQANLGVGGCHHLSQGLEAMRAALSAPLADRADDPRTPEPADGNLGLLRPSARLAVVFLSDEDDHSGFEPESYVQLIQALKGPGLSHRAQVHAIIPTDRSCVTAGPEAPRYAAVALQTGGSTFEVCRSDYSPLLDELAVRAAGAQGEFRLSRPATGPGEIAVRVDGQAVAPGWWTYDAATQSIRFDPAAVPTSGQTVEVRYRSPCG